jgi:hypothetical protein
MKSRRMRGVGYVTRMGDRRGACRVLARKLEGRRPLGRPRHTWEDNIKMDFEEVEWRSMDWVDLAEDRWRHL